MKACPPNVKLQEIAHINPELGESPEDDALVSFVSMSAVTAETASTTTGAERSYSEVKKGYTPFQSGDLLVAKITPCFENGKIAQASLTHRIGFGSTEFHVVRPQAGKAEARYLLHFLRQDRIRRAGERRMTGSAGQRRVPELFLAQLEVPLPSLAEQRRISELLDKADALRVKRRSALALLETVTSSMFLDLFSDPASSATTTLSQCAEVVSGVAKGRDLKGRETVLAPYLRVANVQAGYLDLSEIKTIEVLPSELEDLTLTTGDIVLTEGGDYDKLGRGAMWEGQIAGCVHQNHVFRVRVQPSLLVPRYLHEYLQGPKARAYFLKCAKRTTNLASINLTQLHSLPVLVPPIALQHEFERRFTAAERLKAAHRMSLAALDKLFASLQHRAFLGEL